MYSCRVYFSPDLPMRYSRRGGKIHLVISTEILKEYQRAADELAQQFPGVDVSEIMDLLMVEAEIAHA
jgi:hypothetical protein